VQIILIEMGARELSNFGRDSRPDTLVGPCGARMLRLLSVLLI
jgi:hypothetical protein